jgi:excisionase family DNA binding protein
MKSKSNSLQGVYMDSVMMDKPLTIQQAADFTGFSTAYIYKLVHLKKISCFKPEGGKILFSLDDLKAFVYRNRQAAGYEVQEQADAILSGGRA